jgi:glycosyltransferase involved in cell wall biosynthesis
MMKVSVIIPAYNCEQFLREAVESALDSPWPEKEIIVVDDGSTDKTRGVAALMEEKYPKVVRALAHPDGRNHGVAAARNRGAEESSGEALAFLDADDRMLPNHLMESCAALSEHAQVALTYGRARYLCEVESDSLWMSGQEGGWGPARGTVPEAFDRLLMGNFIQMSTVVCRRGPFFAVGGFESGFDFMQEDYFLWTKMAYRYPIFYLDQLCADYRIHPGSYSVNLEWERVASAKQFEYLYRIASWVPRSDRRAKRALNAAWREYNSRVSYRLYRALKRKDFSQARREMSALWRVPNKARLIGLPLAWRRARQQARRNGASSSSHEQMGNHYDRDGERSRA